MCIPPDQRIAGNDIDEQVYTKALSYCFERRAMLIVDPPTTWLGEVKNGNISQLQPTDVGIEGPETINAAVYFPRVIKEDPMMKNQLDTFSACGIIAGIYAATDVTRGVWKAPAGLDAGILGINSLELKLTDQQNGVLNPLGINCLRTFPIVGSVVWGDRTLRGADILDSDYKYVSVRRLTLYIEESLYQGTKWAVFEPNNENLWSALRLSVGSFMESLSRQGAFYSYQVVCDKTTTTQRDIDLGIVNVLVQFAPVKPAEFVVIQIQQQAGQTT
jgi:phage tail sheath protein FI